MLSSPALNSVALPDLYILRLTPFTSSTTALLAAACLVHSPLSAAPLSAIIEDDVNLYVSVRSLADTRAHWEAHPFAKVVEDPQLQSFLEPFFSVDDAEEEESFTDVLENDFELTVDELFELFPGQIAAALYNMPELILEQAEAPDLVIMVEYAGEPERLTELMQVQFDRNAEAHLEMNPASEHTLIEESFMAETLYFDETFDGATTYIEDGYALVDGIFILALTEERLRSAVEAIKEAPKAALADHANYLRSREEGGRGDLEVYFNLETMMPPLNAALMDQLMQSGAAFFGLSPQSLDALFSFESLQAFFFDVDLIEQGLRSHGGLIYGEKAGILGLLAYTDAPLPEARFVPKGVFSTSITNFDSGEMLARLESLLITASPTFRAQIDSRIQSIRTGSGVDLRSAVLENFGSDIVSLSIMPEAGRDKFGLMEPDQIYTIELEDAEALSSAFEALKDLVPGMRAQMLTQEFAGQTIHTFNTLAVPGQPEDMPRAISYVITRTHFIFSMGRVGLLQEVLSNMESGSDGFWQLSETEDIFEAIERPNAVSRSYVDIEKLVVPIFQTIVQSSHLMGGDRGLDLESIPDELVIPFYMITEMNEASDGFFTRSLMLPREESE